MTSRLLLVAILIRLAIIPWFYHPDIKSQLFHTQYLAHGVTNIYQFLDTNRHQLPYTNIFVYLPFTYFFFGLINIASKPFYPHDLFVWLHDWSPLQNNYPNLPYYLLVLKLPYLLSDILTGFLLFKIFKRPQILWVWLLNPFSLYSIYVQGNFDIIPVMLVVLSYYFLQKQRLIFSFFILGIAIALKMFPIIFLPFFLAKLPKNIKIYFVSLLFSGLPLLLSCLPFLSTSSFISSFVGSGLTQKILELKYFSIPIFPLVFLAIFLFYLRHSQTKLELCLLALMFSFFALVKFHPQWLIWFLPLSLPAVLKNKATAIITLITLSLSILYVFLINDNFLF